VPEIPAAALVAGRVVTVRDYGNGPLTMLLLVPGAFLAFRAEKQGGLKIM
jgi:hypothetical protein